jgi:transposase
VPAHRLVFLDESGANTQMTRRHGRSPIGQRLVCSLPQGHYQTTTLIAAVRLQGPQAPWMFDGAMNGPLFLAWLTQALVPVLRPNDVVVMDNLPTHKVAGVREAIESAGATLEYLPSYSPDLNPIENMWSKVKAGLKSQDPRTARQLRRAAATAFASITPQDCLGFFSHAGYAT